VALAAVVGVAFLLTRSMRSARAEPYSMEAAGLRNWTLALQAASSPRDPVLVLEPPEGVTGRLFDQVRVVSRLRTQQGGEDKPFVPDSSGPAELA
jgi:hypothetical protein